MSTQRTCGSRWLRRIAALSAIGAATSLVTSCAAKKEPAKGQLMLAIQTDMSLPKDVDQVEVQVSVYGNLLFGNTYPVGAGNLLIPATFALIAGDNPSTPVTVRLIARQKGKARVLREVVTTVPSDRTAMLRLPIQWLCDGSANQTGLDTVESSCGNGQTCVGGTCITNKLDSTSLPSFAASSVFGGGTGVGDGACFDTVACFAQGYAVPVTLEGCTIDKPADGEFSIGLVKLPGTDGICGTSACIVPLDADAEGGWTEQNGRIALPQAVCAKLASGDVRSIAVTTACGSKTGSTPTCGPWSAVTTNPGTIDAGAPADAGLADGGGSDGSADGGGCVPKTCADLGLTCGSAGDQCGVPLDCGACSQGMTCQQGACVDGGMDAGTDGSIGCQGGAVWCGAGCADLSTDPLNCGACGNICSGSPTCIGGQCADPPPPDAGPPPTCGSWTLDTSSCSPAPFMPGPPCQSGQVCDIDLGGATAMCMPATGGAGPGQSCASQTDCLPDLYCSSLTGTCAVLCCTNADCTGGQTCMADSSPGAGVVGYCK